MQWICRKLISHTIGLDSVELQLLLLKNVPLNNFRDVLLAIIFNNLPLMQCSITKLISHINNLQLGAAAALKFFQKYV